MTMSDDNLTKRLLGLAEAHPDFPIVRLQYAQSSDEVITYRNLLDGAAGYAKALLKADIPRRGVVILILEHGPHLIYAFFGTITAGAIPSIMPFLTEKLSPETYHRSLMALFDITAPAAVITYPDFQNEVRNAISESKKQCPVLISDHILPIESPGETLFERGKQSSTQDIVLLQHSSGTTGLQKGVALSHQAVFNQLTHYSQALGLSYSDIVVSWLPLYHDMGLIAGFLLPILSRLSLILISPFDWVRAPHKLLHAVSQYQGTLSWLPNFAYNFCASKIRSRDLENVDLSSWRAVINCSEPVLWKSHQLFLERFQPYGLSPASLATCYAMAENVFAITQGGITSPLTIDRINQAAFFNERIALPTDETTPALNLVSCGAPIENTQICILNDLHQFLPDRHLGEVAIRSDCLLINYYRRPDLTGKAFYQGWYLTGDLGYLANGELYVTGRKKDLIIVGGKNIYPQDLENLASEVSGVHPGRVVAFGVPNEDTGTEDVVLIAEAERTADLQNGEQITNALRQQVTRGSDIALRYVKLVERGWLLKTSSGKIARGANREKYLTSLKASLKD